MLELTSKLVPLSRRSFIGNAAMGAAGVAFALSGASGARAGSKETGEITLDALMITYFSAPLGTMGSSSWTFETHYATTIGLRLLENPDLLLKARVPESDEGVIQFSDVRQVQSTSVNNAVALLPRPFKNEFFTSSTPPPGIAEHTTFFGLLKPRLQFDGTSKKLKFRFLESEGEFVFRAKDILEHFGADTANSFLSQYITDTSALIEPRFSVRATIPVGVANNGSFMSTERGTETSSEPLTATTTSRIVEQTGFDSDEVKQAFQVGNHLEISYGSAQEFSGKLITMETTLERTSPGIIKVFWDRIFKTFVIIDAGQP